MTIQKYYLHQLSVILFLLFLASCDKNEVIDPTDSTKGQLKGTGSFTYTGYQPLANKPIEIYYHIPANAIPSLPMLIVFHGNGRDAMESRDALISKSNQYGFILVVPQFSNEYFPGSDTYHLGNIFDDGDHPSASTLNEEDQWTFAAIEPIYNYIKQHSNNTSSNYNVFGHSAGGQFAHRFLIFKPEAHINQMVAASAGWYTVPDDAVDFPYGLKENPAEFANLTYLFGAQLTVMVGQDDTDPNSFALRHNKQADAQGQNRLERAQYFYERSQELASKKSVPFKWQYKALAHVEHDFAATGMAAADIFY